MTCILGNKSSKIAFYENQEILKKILEKSLQNSSVDWSQPTKQILDKFCQTFDVLAECLLQLQEIFEIDPQTEKTLDAYLLQILKTRIDDRLTIQKDEETEAKEKAEGENQEEQEANQDQQNNSETKNAPPVFSREESYRNELWLQSKNLLQFASFVPGDSRAIFTSGDWDQDGDQDLIVGSASGVLYAYQNVGTAKEARWEAIVDTAFGQFQRRFSAPTLADFDSDGDLDILVGHQNGTIELIRNDGTAQKPQWVIADLEFASIHAGTYSVPILHDMNQDQKLEIIIGKR